MRRRRIIGPSFPFLAVPVTLGGAGPVATTFTNAGNATLSNGNLTVTATSVPSAGAQSSTSYSTGKKYCEFTHTGVNGFSTWLATLAQAVGAIYPGSFVVAQNGSNWFAPANNNTGVASVSIGTSGTAITLAIAFDLVNFKAWIRDSNTLLWNGATIGVADPAANIGGADFSSMSGLVPFVVSVNMGDQVGQSCTANFGSGPGLTSNGNGTWIMTPPSGYTNW